MPRLLLGCCLAVALLGFTVPPVAAGDASWTWPVSNPNGGSPTVAGEFDAPDSDYGPGHRGIDVAALVGDPVRAVAGGVVRFVGRVAGIDVVAIDHGTERSTYQPVSATVSVGDRVETGDVIGEVTLGPFHCSSPCLHLGRIAQTDDRYLDPLDRLAGHSRIRLIDPAGPPPVPPVGPSGAGILQRPIAGPVTSPFGDRQHPATGEDSSHDGVDFGAACGTPVKAAGHGTVVAVGRVRAYGLRIVVRHNDGLESFYGHLAATSVAIGDEVDSSTTVGRVGSTGLSTGCHLHFGVRRDDLRIDPLTLL